MLSAQVLSEFFTVVTSRFPNPLSVEEAEHVLNLFTILPVVEIDLRLVRRAAYLVHYRAALDILRSPPNNFRRSYHMV